MPTLTEFADITGVEVQVYHTAGASSRWIAGFRHRYKSIGFKKSKDSALIGTVTGWGETAEAALIDLVKNHNKAEERVMVLDTRAAGAGCDDRREVFNIPQFGGV